MSSIQAERAPAKTRDRATPCEMSKRYTTEWIPHSTIANKRIQLMAWFRVRNLASRFVSTTKQTVTATKVQNVSPGLGQGGVPSVAPLGVQI